MAGEDAELVGGISVSIGASDARLSDDLARAEAVALGWLRDLQAKMVLQVGANFNAPAAASGGRAAAQQAPKIVFGPGAATAAQAQQGQTAMQRLIQSELAKTGEHYNAVTGEIEKATSATGRQRTTILATQEAAAQPTQVNFDLSGAQKSIDAFVASLQEAVTLARELATAAPASAPVAAAQARAVPAGGAALNALSNANAALERNEPASASFARARTPAQQRRFVEEEAARAAALQRTGFSQESRAAHSAELDQDAQRSAQRHRQLAATIGSIDDAYIRRRLTTGGVPGTATAPALRGQALRDAQETIRAAQAQSRVIAETTGGLVSARTGRTAVSGIGAIVLGTRREEIASTKELTAAQQNFNKATLEAARFRDLARRRPLTPAEEKAAAGAIQAEAEATTRLGAAQERVQRLQGFSSVARNLVAITAAGVAFGAGMKAIGIATDLAEKAISPFIARLTGFGSIAAAVTDTLSTQTKAANGNAQAVVAVTEAQAGLSASSAALIQPILTQRASIEAGNKSLSDAVDLFQTYQNLVRTGGAAGITQETGGFLNTGFFGTHSVAQTVGNLFSGLPTPTFRTAGSTIPGLTNDRSLLNPFGLLGPGAPTTVTAAQAAKNLDIFTTGLKFANDQVVKGGESALKFADAVGNPKLLAQTVAAAQAANAPLEFVNGLKDAQIGISGLSSDTATAAQQVDRILRAINLGAQVPDEQLLAQQFNRQRFAQINAANRQQQFALGTQLPAQAALQRLQQPFTPIGTGIVAANAAEAAKITEAEKQTAAVQQDINAYYKQGQDILANTYHVPLQLLDQIKSVSADIAGTQAKISNEQATYTTAQFNYQLFIARRTLSDINGLTGQNLLSAGQSYLGILEKQNLALSRQGQALSFELSQRQINFQVAVAGFEAPGVTPAERQARIKEAQIEASYAQKQLDIQRQMFGNQVKIVDISNLRQGYDLARQIGLLIQGRAVSIDTALAQEKLQRLDAQQQQLVAQVGTYISKVDSLTAAAFSEIQQLEAAAGHAMAAAAQDVLNAYGVVINGLIAQLGGAAGVGGGGGGSGKKQFAGGGLFDTTGRNDITVGEAGNETVAILRNPRAMGGVGGGGTTINFIGTTVRNDQDIVEIARKVEQVMGRKASQLGLRTGG